MSNLRAWIALNFLHDIGPVITRRLLEKFKDPDRVFSASIDEIKTVEGISETRAKEIVTFNRWKKVDEEIQRAEKSGIRIMTLVDHDYPDALKKLPDAPPVLYIKGSLIDRDSRAIAIVGTRSPTKYGMTVAEQMGYELATSGFTVISGMARGIDTMAHKGALRAYGRTIAVLGSGIDMPYPFANRSLKNAIASSGALLSEFPLSTPPNREHFPRRNRIISGLSLGVLVIEATLDSGSMITVRYALDQGKEVFAVPGNITSKRSAGTNRLIKEGAKLVENVCDIVEEISPQLMYHLKHRKKEIPPMSEDEKIVYEKLTEEPKHVDVLIRELNMSSSRLLSLLLKLELKGVVRQYEGKNFALAQYFFKDFFTYDDIWS